MRITFFKTTLVVPEFMHCYPFWYLYPLHHKKNRGKIVKPNVDRIEYHQSYGFNPKCRSYENSEMKKNLVKEKSVAFNDDDHIPD